MLEKTLFINELSAGTEFTEIFLLSRAEQAQAKNGPYWRIELRDAGGSIEGKIWSPLSLSFSELPSGRIVEISAKVSLYRDKLDLHLEALRLLTPEEEESLDLRLFTQASEYSPNDMLEELRELCLKECSHKPWRKFLLAILKDPDICELFKKAPAAKAMHHAYMSGLLEHTLSVAGLCMKIASHYPELDRQVLLAGAVCHDLGKIWEMSGGINNDYTDEGRLIGHINLALEKLEPFLKKSGLSDGLILHLKHLIISHHGELEFGAAKVPQTPEAMILHYADNIDAKMAQTRESLSGIEPGTSGWSSYIRGLDRFIYQPERSPGTQGSAFANLTPANRAAAAKNAPANPEKAKDDQCALPIT